MGNAFKKVFSDPLSEVLNNKNSVIYYSDDEQYVGNIIGQSREGFGMYSYSNGDKYEGQWLNNMKHGKGYFYYNNGELYMGEWRCNKKHGRGSYFYQTGDRFEGDWHENVKDGAGTFYYVDGTVFKGIFQKSKKHGVAILTMPDGTVYEELWEEGECMQRDIISQPKQEEIDIKKIGKEQLERRRRHNRTTLKRKTLDITLDSSVKAFQYINEKLLNKNIKDWDSEDITLWLNRGGFTRYAQNFKSNHITGITLLELTEEDLEKELNISNQDMKKISKDIRFLKKLFPQNPKESKFIREKLLKFYETHKTSLFNEGNPESKEQNYETRDKRRTSLKDVNDVQDQFDRDKQNIALSSSSTSSSSSSDSDESPDDAKKVAGNKKKKFGEPEEKKGTSEEKPKKKSGDNISAKAEQKAAAENQKNDKKRKNVITLEPVKESENEATQPDAKNEEMSFQVSEFHTTFDRYKKYEGDLLQTIRDTLGKRCFIEYNELEIKDKIGEGGYGEVYRGTWLGQGVAIKFYGKKKSRNNKTRIDADFLKEVEVFSRLRHPNILLFMGVSVTPQYRGLLVTEYLEGGSLFDLLHKKGSKFTDEQMVNIALDMALGLNYLHGQKILHCDLKSSNILIDEHQNVKLADFGLSKVRKKIRARKNKRIGTPHWMAPEIMREEEYDEYSDVYSYGMILWELVARKIPYFGLKVNQIVGSVGFGENQVQIPEQGNKLILNLIHKCLNKERKKRPLFNEIVKYLEQSDKQKKYIALEEMDQFFEV